MTLASKPPISRKTSTGMTTAISASDWPRLRGVGRGDGTFIFLVTLRLDPHVGDGRRLQWAERCEEPRLPGVRVVDRDADEVAGALPPVAARGGPRRAVDGCAVQFVLVGFRDIRRQVAIPI